MKVTVGKLLLGQYTNAFAVEPNKHIFFLIVVILRTLPLKCDSN